MSINQLNRDLINFPKNKKWLDGRVNDLTIISEFNIEMETADVEDELLIDAGLNITWVPTSAVVVANLDNASFPFQNHSFIGTVDMLIPLSSVPFCSSPDITVNAQGELVLAQQGVYMVFMNMFINTTTLNQCVGVRLQYYNPINAQFENFGEAFGKTSIVPASGSTVNSQTISAFWYALALTPNPTNHRYRVVGSSTNASITNLIGSLSLFSVVRVA